MSFGFVMESNPQALANLRGGRDYDVIDFVILPMEPATMSVKPVVRVIVSSSSREARRTGCW
ncbi:hypothetical protein [Microbacterium sp. SMR1]|uniref:hypothetical protein n=1 Tax=Microbacterium sp. SMR1 TaxID=1497340 RepID=UPI000DCD3E35|nr:hypothetical protein [Microbacterium sp. SMR1]RAZ30533.1 hypothetical protein DO944_13380 [Microbacterium sp. SMR1]